MPYPSLSWSLINEGDGNIDNLVIHYFSIISFLIIQNKCIVLIRTLLAIFEKRQISSPELCEVRAAFLVFPKKHRDRVHVRGLLFLSSRLLRQQACVQ